jgi:excinuclease UvrABC ATPase subunit
MQCPECKGQGIVKSTEHGLQNVYEECDLCKGTGYAVLSQ